MPFARGEAALIHIITKTLNQYSNIKAQTSDENQTLENYEYSTVVFDDMLLSKQIRKVDLFFAKERHSNNEMNFISHSYFHLPKSFEIVLI